MLAHHVHGADRRARAEQRAIDRLLVFQRDARRRQRQQGGAAAGDQRDRQIVFAEPLHGVQNAPRRGATGGVRHRMRRFDQVDAVERFAMAVTGDDEAGNGMRPLLFDRARHRRRRLAGADHDRASLGRLERRQEGFQADRRAGRGDGGVEHGAQQRAGLCFAHGGAIMA